MEVPSAVSDSADGRPSEMDMGQKRINADELNSLYRLTGKGIWLLQYVEDALSTCITMKKDIKRKGAISNLREIPTKVQSYAQRTSEKNSYIGGSDAIRCESSKQTAISPACFY